ncbi:phosphate ABC transporter permease [Halostella salina]|uniref:phosphate ABC transporter permease n=1 Tax=Halostella salina TaxID=1547897 RepID=UPI000EF76AD9|nr:phosphate ABC transporter permease [Halostella salina]
MSNEAANGEPAADASDRGTDATGVPGVRGRLADTLAGDEVSAVFVASTVALAAVIVGVAVRILANLPFDPVVVAPAVRTATAAAALLSVTAALAAVAVTIPSARVRVGLLFAAVFGCLGVVAPVVTLPAVVAVTAGGGVALAGAAGTATSWSSHVVSQRLVAAGVALAVAVSLSSATGVVDGSLRSAGELLAVASVAAVGARSAGDAVAVGAGLAAVVAFVVASIASPFVVGSALLVGFAITGVPHVLVAVAGGGGVAAAVAGLRRGEWRLAVGAGLLLFAGAPVTLPGAMALLLGAALVLLAGTGKGTDGTERTVVP